MPGALEPKGTLVIDAGAVAALRRGKSLLPAGVVSIEGGFARGDAVIIRGPDGAEIGRGLCAYDAEDAQKIRGRSSAAIESILGFSRPGGDGPSRRSGRRSGMTSVGAKQRAGCHPKEGPRTRPVRCREEENPGRLTRPGFDAG